MFTLDAIKAAHAQVVTGADFPNYIQALSRMGILQFTTFVVDGHTVYQGEEGHQLISEPVYALKTIDNHIDSNRFKNELKAHQQGLTDYPTFVQMCAETGIAYWIMDLEQGQCSYFDKNSESVFTEHII